MPKKGSQTSQRGESWRGRERERERGMVRFLSEIFPASIAPSSERQFVVRAQRESVGRSVGRTDGRTDPRVDRVERSGSFLLFFPLLYSALPSSFSFHSLRLSQLTHSHIQVMSLADAEAERTDRAAGRVVTDPLINW